MGRPTTFAIPHAVDGAAGHYRIPPKGWHGYRQEAFASMAELIGGRAKATWDSKIAAVPVTAVAASWHIGEAPESLRTPAGMPNLRASKL